MTILARLNVKREELEDKCNSLTHSSVPKTILQNKIKTLNELINAYGSTNQPITLTESELILNQQVVGPSGVGKTTFAQIIAQALGKKFFSVALNGLSETSTLLGSENNSPANNEGQLAQALVETKTSNPVILLDEIDKASLPLKNCLLNILDPKQNHTILDYYLDVKLDFSQITFVLTANETKSFLPSLRDRMLIIEIPGYNGEQKKETANKIIQQ
ncbi:10792_t:CDS:2 [Paraglomus occultum]|uniref:10792_t:CDS:1 n=1 Tax=Paraglomus occultum TaxID=144539 RepID=A0A9N9AQS9_9GLOM|nr:10792_t:CDS:2 [Paraglomus occultum]